jgi:hypothetical protein
MPRENGVMTGSRVAVVGKLSGFTGKRLKLQRKLCRGWSVLSPTANLRECWWLRAASTVNMDVREKWRRQEEKGASDPVLSSTFCFVTKTIKS